MAILYARARALSLFVFDLIIFTVSTYYMPLFVSIVGSFILFVAIPVSVIVIPELLLNHFSPYSPHYTTRFASTTSLLSFHFLLSDN